MAEQTQQARLAAPFRDQQIRKNPSGGGEYVKHSVVNEKLLAVVGPFRWECVQVIRGDVAGRKPNPDGKSERARAGVPPLTNAVVGYIGRLTLEVDGRTAVYEEAGDCEEPHNWPTDGARLKDASSDAFKRCAMRAGVGLHLWSQQEFFLYAYLTKDEAEA